MTMTSDSNICWSMEGDTKELGFVVADMVVRWSETPVVPDGDLLCEDVWPAIIGAPDAFDSLFGVGVAVLPVEGPVIDGISDASDS